MAISRGQLVKELEPGLNALFGLEYKRYENQHAEIFDTENSDRAFEEEVMLSGFANAQVKPEGSGVTFDNAQETFTARYTHETIALAFSITEEAIEDNLYDRLGARYTKSSSKIYGTYQASKSCFCVEQCFLIKLYWWRRSITCELFSPINWWWNILKTDQALILT